MLTGAARVAGIMGWPVAHSRSPRLHGYWLRQYGIDGAYIPFKVAPADLETALRALPRLGFVGCNLTLPHKERALELVDDVDAAARRIGAMNTVVVVDGRLRGSNTDGFGFLAALTETVPDFDVTAGPVAVLGAGGAAKAIVTSLADAEAPEIRIANRTRARAERLAEALGDRRIIVVDWAARETHLDDVTLLVNATSLGMQGQPPLALEVARLSPRAVVNDAVYTPLETELLAAARARGNPTVDGLGMLLHQARPGFEAWFGVRPEVTPELRAHVLGEAAG